TNQKDKQMRSKVSKQHSRMDHNSSTDEQSEFSSHSDRLCQDKRERVPSRKHNSDSRVRFRIPDHSQESDSDHPHMGRECMKSSKRYRYDSDESEDSHDQYWHSRQGRSGRSKDTSDQHKLAKSNGYS